MGKKKSNYIKFCDNLSFTPHLITTFFFCHLKKTQSLNDQTLGSDVVFL